MQIDILARRYGGPDGGPEGLAIAVSRFAFVLCELGHDVRVYVGESTPAPWHHARATWIPRVPLFEPEDFDADLIIATMQPAWRRTAIAAEKNGAQGRTVYWHHYGEPPPGLGCVLATPTPIAAPGDYVRSLVLPPSSWALESGGDRSGDAVLVPGAGLSKGGRRAFEVAEGFADLPWLVLPGRASPGDLAPWRQRQGATIAALQSLPETFLARARAVLSPTAAETYGLTLAEAAVRGIPVVCSDLPATRHVLAGVATLMAPGSDTAAWSQGLRDALAAPAKRLRLPPYAETVAAFVASMTSGAVPRAARLPVTATTTAPRSPFPGSKARTAPAPTAAAAPTTATTFPPGSRLHVGCGPKRLAGWINADVKPGADAVIDLHDPKLPASTFAAIYGCHVLEHCYPQDTPRILAALCQALQPGGTLRLSVPDLRLVVANCVDGHAYGNDASALSVLYGGDYARTTLAPDLHRQAFWKERLERLLLEAGFVNVRTWGHGQYPEIDAARDYATFPADAAGRSTISLNLEADRPPPPPVFEPIDVSIILGTVDRPAMLVACVEAVRASCAGLSHEIVIAYGRDNDPSLPWMCKQSDVRPVLGGMTGAIEAFNRAYTASVGRYICQINDDVMVDGDSIARAVRHLDADPTCAGVVFQFDRLDGAGYRHERLGGTLHPNQIVARRSTCEAVVERIGGFWGDAAHRTDKTYGGDSAFGALCHHLGLRLDSVDGVTCRDLLVADATRAGNAIVDPQHWPRWNGAYKPLLEGPVHVASADEWPRLYLPRPGMAPRRSPLEAGRPLRLLHLSLAYDGEPLDEQRRQFARIGETVEVRWHGREREAVEAARAHRPDLVWAQIQSDAWTPDLTEALRAAAGPACTLALWTGDVRTSAAQPVERWLVRAGQRFDLILADGLTYPRKLALDERVPASCGYLACGIDPTLNPWEPDAVETGGVVFVGAPHRHLGGDDREALLSGVAAALPGQLTIYGSGWGASSLAPIARPFVAQRQAAHIMRRASVTIAQSLFSDLERYTSDRLTRAMHAGAVVAVRRFPDMEGLGLIDRVNCLAWSTSNDLDQLIAVWTRPDYAPRRAEIRRAASALAAERYPWSRTVEELLAIVRGYRERRGLR